MKKGAVTLFLLLTILASVVAQNVEYESAVKWEYNISIIPIISNSSFNMLQDTVSLMTTLCNQYGIDRWEIVSTTPLGGSLILIIFKRPILEADNQHPRADTEAANDPKRAFPRGLNVCSAISDLNKNKVISKDELVDLGKTSFDLDKEALIVSFYMPDVTGELTLQTLKDTGQLIGETKVFTKKDTIEWYHTGPGGIIPDGDFLDKLKAAGPGNYIIAAIFNGVTYTQNVIIK
jgi:hypothetical protein